jgi:hypothetical protein
MFFRNFDFDRTTRRYIPEDRTLNSFLLRFYTFPYFNKFIITRYMCVDGLYALPYDARLRFEPVVYNKGKVVPVLN